MNKANKDIREAAKKQRVCLWEVAERLGVSEATMVRKLRRELPEEERTEILGIIEEIAKERC